MLFRCQKTSASEPRHSARMRIDTALKTLKLVALNQGPQGFSDLRTSTQIIELGTQENTRPSRVNLAQDPALDIHVTMLAHPN